MYKDLIVCIAARAVRALAVALALPAAAGAAPIVTYTGTILDFQDFTGIFAVPFGPERSSLAFTAVFTLTDSIPPPNVFNVPGHMVVGDGGTSLGLPTLFNATLTINGITRAFGRDYRSGFRRANDLASGGSEVDAISHFVAFEFRNSERSVREFIGLDVLSRSNEIVDDLDLSSPVSYRVNPTDSVSGDFSLIDVNLQTDQVAAFAMGRFNVATVTIGSGAAANPIPEPQTGALATGGLVLLWLARLVKMRRRDPDDVVIAGGLG